MQFGKSLVGAIIGAAVGIGLLLAVYLTLGIDKIWLSIPFAIITGLGVRMLVSTSGHASYVRGALTMLIALAAYIGGWLLVAKVATARANAPSPNPAAAAGDAEAQDGETKDAEGAEKTDPVAQPKVIERASEAGIPRAAAPKPTNYSPADMIFLAIAALVAYELGRGSGMAKNTAGQPGQPLPADSHPDA